MHFSLDSKIVCLQKVIVLITCDGVADHCLHSPMKIFVMDLSKGGAKLCILLEKVTFYPVIMHPSTKLVWYLCSPPILGMLCTGPDALCILEHTADCSNMHCLETPQGAIMIASDYMPPFHWPQSLQREEVLGEGHGIGTVIADHLWTLLHFFQPWGSSVLFAFLPLCPLDHPLLWQFSVAASDVTQSISSLS